MAISSNATAVLPSGAWDVVTFLSNAQKYATKIMGGILILIGTVGLGWGVVQLFMKLFQPQKNQTSWITIVILIIVGGGFMIGGWTLATKVGSGGQRTVTDLGGGVIL